MVDLIARSQYRSRPWRNGAGTSDDIAVEGDAAAPDFAVSETTITADCAFSDYRGYDRTIVWLQGWGFALTFDDGESAIVDAARPAFSFDGGRAVSCRLIDGPVRAFNVITARARKRHTVELTGAPPEITVAAGETVFFHAADTVRIDGPHVAERTHAPSGPFEAPATRLVRITGA